LTSDEECGPQRTCLGCRKAFARKDLLRFVLAPQGELLVDYKGKLPGRGAYTCVDPACIGEAIRRRQFSRTFKRELLPVADDYISRELSRQIQDRISGLIGMARKAHQLLSGSSLILDRLSAGAPLAFVVIASDVSDGIGKKVIGRATNRSVRYYRMFEKEFLGRLLGTGQRSVLALLPGSLAAAIRVELERYQRIAGEY
jgi:predicted RNA-binding protein YlxR (DUF448 family)